jgi:hypothetical protein
MDKIFKNWDGFILKKGKKYNWSGLSSGLYSSYSWKGFKFKIMDIKNDKVLIRDYDENKENWYSNKNLREGNITFKKRIF